MEHVVSTKFGEVRLTVNNGGTGIHVHNAENTPFVIYGVEYNLTLNLGLYDSEWSLQRNSSGRPEYSYLGLRKIHEPDWKKQDGSEKARAKALEVLLLVVNEWAKKNTIVIDRVAFQKAEEVVDGMREKHTKLLEQLAEVEKVIELDRIKLEQLRSLFVKTYGQEP